MYNGATMTKTTNNSHFPRRPVSIPAFTGAKDDGSGGDNWSCKMCKAPVKSSPPTNQHPAYYRPAALPIIQQTVPMH